MTSRSLHRSYSRAPVWLQSALVAASGWNRFRHRFGKPFRTALAELQARDESSEEQVRDYQERRLRGIVSWASRTVPFYRELFQKEGVDPASIRSIEDLARLPAVDKQTVRARTADFVSEEVPRRSHIPGHTAGTTGTALALVHTQEALGWQYAAVWRQRGWWSLHLGDRFAAFGGQQIVPFEQEEPPFWRNDVARNRTLFSLYHMSPKHLIDYARELMRPGYQFWQGYPSSIALVAHYLLDHDLELGAAAPKAVFTSSETLLEGQRSRIEQATGASVVDHYANAELCVAVSQCPQGSYHIDTELCALEIDPIEETEDWVRGEVIATGFSNRAMPLLRYRTGDVATLRKKGGCPCGRRRPLLDRIDGRIEDYVITPDGRRVGRMDHIFKSTLEVREAQIYQPAVRQLVVRIVPGTGWGADVERRLDHELQSRLGKTMEISYELHDVLPRGEHGKFRAVISDVAEGRLQ